RHAYRPHRRRQDHHRAAGTGCGSLVVSSICVASHHTSLADLLANTEFRALAQRENFLLELRLDYYTDLTLENLVAAIRALGSQLVVTFRHPAEGGKAPEATDEQRVKYLQAAADLNVAYIDI